MSTAAVCAQIVEEIQVEGNVDVPDSDILRKLTLESGLEYDPGKASDDLTIIYDMGKFDDVSASIEDLPGGTIRVIYRVEEKPAVEKIEFKGNDKIKSKKLKKKIDIKKDDFFDEFLLQDDIKKIKDFYREEGYAECSIEAYPTKNEDNNTVEITFYVEEGNKIKIKEINLIGVLKEKYKKVRKKVKTKTGKTYQQNQLEEDAAEIKKFYKDNGYLNVDIEGPVITYDESHSFMYVTFFVGEGSKYFLDNITFRGNMRIPDKAVSEAIELKKSDVYSISEIRKSMMLVQEVYGREGYIKMGVVPHYKYDDENQKLDVDLEIFEGPKVFVRNVYIDGNYITRDYVIEREFKIKEGEPFNLDKVRDTQGQMFKLGFFSDVKVDMLPTGSEETTDLVFIVEEQKTGMASVGAGYSSVDKLVGTVRVSQDNLFGRGQRLSVMWEFGTGETKKQNYRIDFTEPYLFNTPTPFGVSVYNMIRTRFLLDYDYNEQRRGGSLSIGRHFTDELTAYLKYSLEQIRIYDIDEEIQDEVSEGRDTTSSVTPSLIYDKRDYPFDPSTGYYLRASNQVAGGIFGGDRDFIKFEGQATYFQPILWKAVGVINLVNGSVAKYSDTDEVPIYERFNVGGAESIRGYDYWEIGPPEGGNYKIYVNAEIKFPIVMEKKQTILQGAFFYDVGSAWKYANDIIIKSGLEEDKLKRGYGFGIRFKTRAFPIRLDWGYGIDKRPKESQWYFTLGDIF